MIFIVLNALLAGFLIYASVNVNTKNQGTGSSMVGIMMLDAVSTLYRLSSMVRKQLQIFSIILLYFW